MRLHHRRGVRHPGASVGSCLRPPQSIRTFTVPIRPTAQLNITAADECVAGGPGSPPVQPTAVAPKLHPPPEIPHNQLRQPTGVLTQLQPNVHDIGPDRHRPASIWPLRWKRATKVAKRMVRGTLRTVRIGSARSQSARREIQDSSGCVRKSRFPNCAIFADPPQLDGALP